MKNLNQYINEHRTTDIIKIVDTSNNEVKPVKFAYDSESLDEFLTYYEKNSDYFIGKELTLCRQDGQKWKTLREEGFLDLMKPNDEYYRQGKMVLNYQELHDKLDKGEYILILKTK